MTDLAHLAHIVRSSRGLAHKGDIAPVMRRLGLSGTDSVPVGDDTAAIADGNGHLLFAIEGFMEDFVAADPWFAGYCGVMVNVSDIWAMGGHPIALVDALWSDGEDGAALILEGMREAARRYHVPVVGGHSNLRSAAGQLAVAILGRTEHVVTSFDARPGDTVLVATDLNGSFRDPFPWWDASTCASDEHIASLLPLMPTLAERGLLTSAKDISMAGVIGTAIMLAEASQTGMEIDLGALPIPPGVPLEKWLTAFPSFGFVMTADPDNTLEIIDYCKSKMISCTPVGHVTDHPVLVGHLEGESTAFWSLDHPLIGCHQQEKIHA